MVVLLVAVFRIMVFNSETHEKLFCEDGEFSKYVLALKSLKAGESINALVFNPEGGPKRLRVIIDETSFGRCAKPVKRLSIPRGMNPNLTVSKSINLGTKREFNHLRISNLDVFLKEYSNSVEFYASPFKILRELEKAVMFKDDPDDFLLISYKPTGDIMFRLDGVGRSKLRYDDRRIVTYTYEGSVS